MIGSTRCVAAWIVVVVVVVTAVPTAGWAWAPNPGSLPNVQRRPSRMTNCNNPLSFTSTTSCFQQQKQPPLPVSSTALSAAASAAVAAMPSVLLAVSQPLGSIAILAFIVLVHESGHYLAAKNFGIAVEEFSIGFGPKLWGFSRNKNTAAISTKNTVEVTSTSSNGKTSTTSNVATTTLASVEEFNLRALPLGGYVRFPENYNTTLAIQVERDNAAAAADFIRQRQPGLVEQIWNALTLGFWEDKLWNDEKQRRRLQAEVAAATAAIQKRPWWKSLVSSKTPSKSSSAASAAALLSDEIQYYDNPDLLQNRPWPQRAVVLSGGVVFNLLLAYSIYFGQIAIGSGLPVPTYQPGIVVNASPRPGTPANGILRQGDVILQVDHVPVMMLSSKSSAVAGSTTLSAPVSATAAQRSISDFIAKIRATPQGGSLTLTVLHANEANPVQVIVKPTQSNPNYVVSENGKAKQLPPPIMTIGTLLSPNYGATSVLKTSDPVQAAALAWQYFSALTVETASGLAQFAASLVSPSGGGGGGGGVQVSGPLGLIRSGSEVVATQDWTTVLLFTAAISINLGVVNSMPLPALDGGQLVFVLTEALSGRKVDQRIQERLTSLAVLFLLLLTASTFVGDVTAAMKR